MPVLAFLTDFGTSDHYVGAMKGVALGICPEATLVDITHDIPPQDVLSGALELAAAVPFFPLGTIFVAVVDPGVGSARRAIAVEAGGFRFVAPDNGLLTLVLVETPPTRIVELTSTEYARPVVSRTFEGRDRFAPAAAWLATGVAIDALGGEITNWHRIDVPVPSIGDGRVTGTVVRIDRFGNLITNIDHEAFASLTGSGVAIDAGGHVLDGMVATYAETATGTVCALFGSSGHLEVAMNGGNAAATLRLGRGAPVTITRV